MCAVAEATMTCNVSQLAETVHHLFWRHMPEPEFTNPRRVNQITAGRKVIEACGRGCMFALTGIFRQGTNAQVFPRKQSRNQGRLAHPRGAGDRHERDLVQAGRGPPGVARAPEEELGALFGERAQAGVGAIVRQSSPTQSMYVDMKPAHVRRPVFCTYTITDIAETMQKHGRMMYWRFAYWFFLKRSVRNMIGGKISSDPMMSNHSAATLIPTWERVDCHPFIMLLMSPRS